MSSLKEIQLNTFGTWWCWWKGTWVNWTGLWRCVLHKILGITALVHTWLIIWMVWYGWQYGGNFSQFLILKLNSAFTLQVVSWIITIWIFGSLTIFLLARVLGGEVSAADTCQDNSQTWLELVLVKRKKHFVWSPFVLWSRFLSDRFLEWLDIPFFLSSL